MKVGARVMGRLEDRPPVVTQVPLGKQPPQLGGVGKHLPEEALVGRGFRVLGERSFGSLVAWFVAEKLGE